MKNAFQLWDEKIFAAHEIFGFNGAVRNGLEFHEIFGAFAGKQCSPFHEWNAFGDSEKIEGSRHDPFHLADEIAEHSPQKCRKFI